MPCLLFRRLVVGGVFWVLAGVIAPWGAALAAGPELVCPARVPEGEPFVARVVSATPFPSARFFWLGRSVTVPAERLPDGRTQARVLLGMGMKELLRDERHTLRAEVAGGTPALLLDVTRTARAYPEQHLTVAKRYVTPSPANLERIRREQAEVKRLLTSSPAPRHYDLPFLRPVPGGVSSAFGLRRFLNGEPRAPHGGVDLRAAQGSPVLACADGTVVLVAAHYFAGNSIYVDHGEGVLSMYFHLSRMDVTPGQTVTRGQVLGAVGATGRVTGPHLHWGVSVLGQKIDPLLLTASGR